MIFLFYNNWSNFFFCTQTILKKINVSFDFVKTKYLMNRIYNIFNNNIFIMLFMVSKFFINLNETSKLNNFKLENPTTNFISY